MRTADKFCDLAGFDPEREEAVIYAHDGSQLTLIEIDGGRTIVSPEDYLHNVVERFAAGLAQILKRPGHQITISYESSLNVAKVLDPFFERQTRRARQKALSLDALIEESRGVLEGRARREDPASGLDAPYCGAAGGGSQGAAGEPEKLGGPAPGPRRTEPVLADRSD